MPQLVYVEGLPEIKYLTDVRNNLVKSEAEEDYRKKLKTISSWYSNIDHLSDEVDSYKDQVEKEYRYTNITNKNNKKKRP